MPRVLSTLFEPNRRITLCLQISCVTASVDQGNPWPPTHLVNKGLNQPPILCSLPIPSISTPRFPAHLALSGLLQAHYPILRSRETKVLQPREGLRSFLDCLPLTLSCRPFNSHRQILIRQVIVDLMRCLEADGRIGNHSELRGDPSCDHQPHVVVLVLLVC